MYIKYFADDGTEFDCEYDCIAYEGLQELHAEYKSLFDIEFWDKDGNPYKIDPDDAWNDRFYIDAEKVKLPDDSIEAFKYWSEYGGWCEFEDYIDKPGTWVRKQKAYGDEWFSGCDYYWERIKD